ncbi:MAG: histidine kinase [Clostridia bacterium]|nr:histidine kinase [Clostridia bacterium]
MKKQIASAKSDYSFARKNIVRFAVRISVPVVMAALIVLTFLLYIECAPGISDTRLPFNFGLNFCGMALLLFLAIAVSLDSTPEDSASVFFSILLSAVFVGAMTNAISIIASGNMQFFVLNKISTFICCLCSPITCFVYCCYQEALYDVKSTRKKVYLFTLGAFAIADVLLFVLNLKFGFIYYFDSTGIYTPGNLYGLYILYPALVLSSGVYVTRRILGFAPKKGAVLAAFSLCFVLSCVLIVTNDQFSCTFVFFALAVLLLYGAIQASRGREISEKNEMLAKQAMDLVKQEQQIMISQINPHFLYNTLSTIECLCETDPVLAGETVHNFADYLRGNVDTLQKAEAIPFAQEMDHLGHYVEIEKLRFPNIRVEYDLADCDFCLPSLTVQPMVENAIRYGVRTVESGLITVRSYFDNFTHYIEIEDNGCGFDVNAPKKDDGRTHIGISNVRARLEKMVNGNLVIISKPGNGTKVMISIPAKKEENG